MGAVGGVAILGGNFEAATFPEDKVVQRSLTAGTQESSPIDAIILDALPLGAPGQLDSHAFIWKGHSNNGSPHTIDWKAFVNVTADDGTGSLWTLQTRIDGAPYTDILTVDDNGLLTVSGATLTMDQLIIDTDNTEAVLIRKDGDAGDVFIVDTVNSEVKIFGQALVQVSSDTAFRVRAGTDPPIFLVDTDNGGQVTVLGNLILPTDAFIVGSIPATTGTIRLSNADSITARRLDDAADLNIFDFGDSNEADFGDADMPIIRILASRLESNRLRISQTSQTALEVNNVGNTQVLVVDTSTTFGSPLVRVIGGTALTIGTLPALSGSIRIAYADSITFRNSGNNGDFVVISTGASNVFIFGDAGMERIEFPSAVIFTGEFKIDHDGAAFRVQNTSSNRVFEVNTSGVETVTVGATLDRSAAVVDRFRLTGSNLSVNSTVGFSHAVLLEGQARTAGGVNHDATWRMYVEPLTTTAFDGQSVFKITAEIDTGGPTTVFTLSDTGDLIVPGSFTIDGLIIDVDSTEAFLVRMNGDGGDVFNVDTVNSLIQVIGSAALTIGATPAASGSIRMSNASDIVWRNSGDSGDNILLSVGSSDEMILGESTTGPFIRVVPELRCFDRLTDTVDSVSAFSVTGANLSPVIFRVDTINEIVKLNTDATFLAFGASSDAQIHRDAADIISQRRGLNPQEWRLYDRFVSLSDYDRLAIYIGGGPPLKTIEFVAESTVANQGISIDIEARAGSSADGRLNLMVGSALLQMSTGQATLNTPFSITSTFSNSLNLSGFMILGPQETTAGVGIKIDIGGQGAAAFEDSHSIDLIGAGENNNRATWRTFVDVIDVGANSIWTLQDDKNGGGFVTNFSITDDGGFNFPLPLPSHAIGGSIDLSSQLTLRGDYFSLLSGGTTASRFKTEDRITGATGQIVGLFQSWFGGNIRTQTATESVANIATVQIDEPNILDNLTGGGLITHAQTLLITGAPTEGVNNYALRILSGDIEIDDSAAFLFDDGGGGNLSALSVAPTNRLEIGLSGAPWGRINLYSQIINNIGGDLRIVATAANHSAETQMQVTFADVATSAGSSVTAASLIPAGSFVIGVTVRVLTTVTGPTGFDVGDGIDVDRWGNSILVAAGTVTNITSFTSGSVTTFQVANDVVITSDGVDFTGGSIRITVHYTQLQTSAA